MPAAKSRPTQEALPVVDERDRGEFCVYQFFSDIDYELVAQRVSGKTAVQRAKNLTVSLGGKLGTTQRVIITDGGDMVCFEWKFGEGVVFPTEAQIAATRQLDQPQDSIDPRPSADARPDEERFGG
jgi:hypothetical protein